VRGVRLLLPRGGLSGPVGSLAAVTLALYRKYRPAKFVEVVGQEHVTDPLSTALAAGRINHAYLFSGPRGCGKTSSARILARSLNCEQGPTPDPCGVCASCIALAPGGPGNIDVTELDAASHGGVDDTRELRDRAFFAPAESRYRVFIVDEAHMITTQGFNALLKIVEEPPEHLVFVFATTEPDKVLPTIRSRTHHYPFRLIPPRLLSSYLSQLCEQEGVAIEPAALPLVVRAGAGSARDSLSVLDQLLGGASDDGVTHALASGLLGYTPDTLLDDVVDAFAAGDGSAVFAVVDRVIETGQDPRRFTEDLLRRLRDLVIVAAVPDAPATGLIDVSEDQGERLVAQAARFGNAELSRAADLVAAGLTEMRGATAPRLLLELICARVLLPGADHSTAGVLARLDRLEKRAAISGTPSAQVSEPAAAPAVPAQDRPTESAPPLHPRPVLDPPMADVPAPVPAAPPESAAAPQTAPARETAVAGSAIVPAPSTEPDEPASPAPGARLSLVDVRRLWPDIVDATKQRRRVTWIHLTHNAQVVAVDATTLTLGFANSGARESFDAGGSAEIVRQAAIDVVGADWQVETIVDPGADAEAPPPPPAPAVETGPPASEPSAPPEWADADSEPAVPGAAESASPRPQDPEPVAAARDAIRQTRPAGSETGRDDDRLAADADARPDDLDADVHDVGGTDLLARELGAQMIEEIPHS